MANLIQKTDTLNAGRIKLNEAIVDAEKAKADAGSAVNTSNQARQIAQTAENKADSVQAQFDQVVIEGDSSVEAAAARVDEKNETHPTLKARIDDGFTVVSEQLADTVQYVNVNKYGALGDGTTNDLKAIESALNYAKAIANVNNKPTLYFPNSNGYLIEDTLIVPPDINVVMDSPLLYRGVNNKPCLILGEEGVVNSKVKLKLSVKNLNLSDWSNEDSIGIKLINTQSSNIEKVSSDGFTIGVQAIGSGQGFVYNEITLGDLANNKISVDLTNETFNFDRVGWTNENNFYGGRFRNASSTNTSLSRYGVRITTKDGSYKNNNNNLFHKPSFELMNPNNGEAIPVLIEHGMMNSFEKCRNEGNSDIFARFLNKSERNSVNVGYGGVTIEDFSEFPTNVGTAVRSVYRSNLKNCIFQSGNIRTRTELVDTTLSIEGLFFLASSGILLKDTTSGYTLNPYSITATGTRAIGVRLTSDNAKRFVIKRDVSKNNPGRVMVKCYDKNMNVLGDGTELFLKGSSSEKPFYSTAYGGVYQLGADSSVDFYFELSEEVEFIDVACYGEIRGFSVYSDGNSTYFSPFDIT